MLLKALTLENFKGIREPVRIELKPITLLFGPNSAGKSTIVQALHYAHEILERHNVDPGRTLMGGEAIELGGFESLVHGHDLEREIHIVLAFDLSQTELPVYRLPYVTSYSDLEFDLDARVRSAELGLTVAWSERLERPVLREYTIGLNGTPFAEISSTADARQIEAVVNLDHPIFPGDEESGLGRFVGDLRLSSWAEAEVETLSGLEDATPQDIGRPSTQIRFGVLGQSDPLPAWGKPLDIQQERIEILEPPDRSELIEMFSKLIVGPGELARNLLKSFRYLGPLREVPPRSYEPARSPDEARWARGLAAWDVLYRSEDAFLEEVNKWATREDRLDTGYRVDVKRYKELDENSPLMLALKRGHTVDEEESLLADLDALPTKYRLYLEDEKNGIEMLPQDVGVGISQLLPVIVAALHSRRGIVAIEQPELHIHPAWQVVLGDLFLSQIKDKDVVFLIETHSEHLMLRLLRRVRETADGNLPPGMPAASPGDIAVYYVEQQDGATVIKDLRIDPTGDFIDRWPRGFFEERAEELF